MVISVPVFSPCRDLQGAEPPDVLARVHAVRKAGFEVQQAVHEGLHVQAVDKSNGAKPKETGPAKNEVTKAQGNRDKRNLQIAPDGVPRLDYVGAPLLHARRVRGDEGVPPRRDPGCMFGAECH